MRRLIDLTGQRFGRLTVIERSNIKKDRTAAVWKCQCDCGNTKIIAGRSLRSGNTASCGCLMRDINAKASLEDKRFLKVHTPEVRNKAVCTINESNKAFITNLSTGIKNISYVPRAISACYQVAIIRDKRKYCQSFSTLQDAVRAKEYVLSRYKKCIPNWNDKL